MVTNVLALAGLMAISAILKRIFRNAPRETRLEKYNADYALSATHLYSPSQPLTAPALLRDPELRSPDPLFSSA